MLSTKRESEFPPLAPEAVERKCVLVSGEKYSYKASQEVMEQLLEVGEPSIPYPVCSS